MRRPLLAGACLATLLPVSAGAQFKQSDICDTTTGMVSLQKIQAIAYKTLPYAAFTHYSPPPGEAPLSGDKILIAIVSHPNTDYQDKGVQAAVIAFNENIDDLTNSPQSYQPVAPHPTDEAIISGAVSIRCVNYTPGAPPAAQPSGQPRLVIRKDNTDLGVTQEAADTFNSTKSGTLSFSDALYTNQKSYDIELAVGYAVIREDGGHQGYSSFSVIPYGQIARKFTTDDNNSKKGDLDQLQGGVELAAGNLGWHGTISPSYVRDYLNKAMIFAVPSRIQAFTDDLHTNKEITKDIGVIFDLSGLANAGNAWETAANSVIRHGGFLRFGVEPAMQFIGKNALQGFSLSADYRALVGADGNNGYYPYLDTALEYDLTQAKMKFVTLKLEYTHGYDANTLEKDQTITVGLGLRY